MIFQSTPPSREATYLAKGRIMSMTISIHAPLTGGDTISATERERKTISIHAPLTGGDA